MKQHVNLGELLIPNTYNIGFEVGEERAKVMGEKMEDPIKKEGLAYHGDHHSHP